jgi:hypothetical protein
VQPQTAKYATISVQPTPYDPDYVIGLDHFNRHEFFEAHEVWEDLWARSRGPDQLFYKGLIHSAVALLHFGNGNLRGARKVLGSCFKYLEAYAPTYLGLDVRRFLDELSGCFGPLADPASETAAPDIGLDESRIPRMELEPPPCGGVRGQTE